MERELAAERVGSRARGEGGARTRAGPRARPQAAREATDGKRPSDEELGYIKTDDSFSKIFSDAVSELSRSPRPNPSTTCPSASPI